MLRRIAVSYVCLSCLLVTAQASAGPPPKITSIEAPQNILFIGNSFTYYNNGLHNYLRQLIREADKPEGASGTLKLMTISGAKLSEHASALRAILKSEDWDVVVLQGNSLEAVNRKMLKNFRNASRAFRKEIQNSGADTVFFMTWAYTDRPEMTDSLDTSYTIIGNLLDSLVVPVGRAFERAQQQYPGISLIMKDKKHPTLAGTYLAACVFYAAMFQQSPVALEYHPARLNKAKARALREVAWETVRAYYDDEQTGT